MFRFVLFVCLWMFGIICNAQAPALHFHKIAEELLQGAEVERFFVTKDGCLWFGTNEGLASFDGSEMVHYGNKGLTGTSSYRVQDLVEDKKGDLWLVTPEYGVLYFNRKTGLFRRIEININEQIKSPQTEFVKICIDKQGFLWIGTWNRGLFVYNPATNVYSHYNLNPDKPASWESRDENTVRNITEDIHDSSILWLAGFGSGIYSFNKQTKQLSKRFKCFNPKDSISYPSVTGLYQVNDSTIWFSTWGYGMGEYKIKTGIYRAFQRSVAYRIDVYSNGHILEYIAQKSDSEFYVAPRDTIPAVFNIHTKKYYFINDNALNEEFQRTQNVKTGKNDIVYFEKGGSLFIGSPKLDLFRTIQIAGKINFVYPEINCLLWDEKQQEYFAGILLGEGVYVYDKDFRLKQKIPMPLYSGKGFSKSTVIWKLHRDKAGNLWALGYLTCVYDSTKQRFIPVKEKWHQLNLLDSSMYDMAEDSRGMLYFNSANNELIELNPFTLHEKKIPVPEIGKTAALSFYNNSVVFDSARNYIYFTNNNSLYQYNIAAKTFRKLYVDSSYYTNQTKQFYYSYMLDKQGYIWLSTPDQFLWKISPVTFKIVDTIKFAHTRIDLNGAHFYGAYNEYLFLSTLRSQLLFNTTNYQCIYLNRDNGLLLNEGSKQMVCNDKIFFSYSGNGKTQFASIDKLLQQPQKIIPNIVFILVNNKPVISDTLPQYLRNLKLNFTHNTISIGFSAIDTEFPERLEYSYKLENADKEWIYATSLNRRINYANLSPGKYVFRVKAREAGLNWSPETTLTISIAPPFWQTWWFITLSALLFAALLLLLIQKRIRTIRMQEQQKVSHEKELLELEAKALRAQMNPHFIFNCMNSIKALIQKNEQDKAIIYLTTFSKLIRTIFQNSDKREITLFDEIETCRLYTQLESMRFGNKFSYKFKIDETLDLKSVMVPALIIQPFIENAIWHGIMPKEEGGNVIVTVDKTDHTICCIIDDDGIGRAISMRNKFITESASHQSKGVRLTQARLDLNNLLNEHNATVEIIDKSDKNEKPTGTVAVISIKED